MKNVSVNVPLQGVVLDRVLRAQKILDKEMNISFQKKNQSVPHINLLSTVGVKFSVFLNIRLETNFERPCYVSHKTDLIL